MAVSYLNFVFFIEVKAKSKYRILNFVFQFIKKTKWHFGYTDSSAYSKSSNSSGFNSILQKFYEMIREVIVSKTLSCIFLFFCRSSFINNFIAKSNFSEPLNHQNSGHRLEDHISTNKL